MGTLKDSVSFSPLPSVPRAPFSTSQYWLFSHWMGTDSS